MAPRANPLLPVLLVVLLLATPGLAQDAGPSADPEGDPASDPGSDPAPPQDPGGPPSNETPTAQAEGTASAVPQHGTIGCRVIANDLGDPRVPRSQWLVIDPDGCLRATIKKILERPTSVLPGV